MTARQPCSGIEQAVADRVERVMPAEGITPGPRECHDAQPGRLRVDFVYSQAHARPIAMEVTMLTLGWHRAGVKEADRLIGRLSTLAEREEPGAWLVTVRTDSSLKSLEPEIAKVLRDAQAVRDRLLREGGEIRPGHYTSQDLFALPSDAARKRFAAEHKRLKGMGLVSVKPVQAAREHVVGVLPMTGMREIGSFAEDLSRAVAENSGKLGEASGLEHHLAVLVDRFDASTEPALTGVPPLPRELDMLWVVHRYRHGGDWLAVWAARRGDSVWRVHRTES
jgi:hypothetical protein